MNSKVLLFALFSLLIGFSSCDKSNDDEPANSAKSIPLIKTIVSSGNSADSTYYEYDETGRVIKESHGLIRYTQYTYALGKVTINSYEVDPTYNSTSVVNLNDKGLASSRKYGDITYTFKYDSIGYHVLTNYNYDTVFYAKVVDGNTIMKMETNKGSSTNIAIKTWDYQFLNSKNTIGFENMGMTWYGRQNVNLPLKETTVFISGNYIQNGITEYTYEYDSQNRVAKKITTWDGKLYKTEYYTYY